jgi:DNA-binding response OmpR family regulator
MLDTRALVVDDDAAIRGQLVRSVKRIITEADEAADGSQAQRLFDQYEHPLVILDLLMPGVGGMEVLRHIKTIHPASQVILLSAHGEMKDVVEALNLDAFQYIVKPPKLLDLESALQAAYKRYLLFEPQSGARAADAAAELEDETRTLYARLAELAARRASSPHDQSIQHEYDAVFRRLRAVQSVEAEHARAAFRARLALPRGEGYRALQAAREELTNAPVPNPAEPAASPRDTDPETT